MRTPNSLGILSLDFLLCTPDLLSKTDPFEKFVLPDTNLEAENPDGM